MVQTSLHLHPSHRLAMLPTPHRRPVAQQHSRTHRDCNHRADTISISQPITCLFSIRRERHPHRERYELHHRAFWVLDPCFSNRFDRHT